MRIALAFLSITALLAIISWRNLETIRQPDRNLIDFIARAAAVYFVWEMLRIFQCVRERIILGINLASLSMWFVVDYIREVGVHGSMLEFTQLTMWTLASMVSATMLASAIRFNQSPPIALC
jgi:hypothetical protein